ncbi:MAG: 30S ribosomal protein S13 [Patescibacteria group bacterium]
MIRIAGINLPDHKKADIALTYIYGIGRTTARKIVSDAGGDPDMKLKDIAEREMNKVRDVIERSMVIEGDLRREIQQHIKSLKEINCYRGSRHKAGLPARGQRTKTNARTKRGKRVTMGSGRRKVTKT